MLTFLSAVDFPTIFVPEAQHVLVLDIGWDFPRIFVPEAQHVRTFNLRVVTVPLHRSSDDVDLAVVRKLSRITRLDSTAIVTTY